MLKPHFYFDIFTKKLDSFVFNLEQLSPVWIQVACLQNLFCNIFPIILQNVLRKIIFQNESEFLVNSNQIYFTA